MTNPQIANHHSNDGGNKICPISRLASSIPEPPVQALYDSIPLRLPHCHQETIPTKHNTKKTRLTPITGASISRWMAFISLQRRRPNGYRWTELPDKQRSILR